nr:hypothetical protein [Tanacetum cinerariifolium]GEZ42355.1 hypothetical protein [Tanacetum cinerariifolium]
MLTVKTVLVKVEEEEEEVKTVLVKVEEEEEEDNCSTAVATSINNAGVANASSMGGHTPKADIAGFSALLLLSGDLLIELFT